MMAIPQHRRLYLSANEREELDTGDHDDNLKINTEDGSLPDNNLTATLHEDENEKREMNEDELCFNLRSNVPYIKFFCVPCVSREV